MAIDLDGFRGVNERHGHDVGDSLLIEVARRIEDSLRAYDPLARPGTVVSRLGGDEFFALCDDVANEAQAAAIARRMLAALQDPPVAVANEAVHITASVGVALSTGAVDDDGEQFVLAAEAAMHAVKNRGGNGFDFFDERVRQATATRSRLTVELEHAIAENQLELHYQPKINRLGNGDRRRGSRPMGASRARSDFARRLHSTGGGDGPHRPSRDVGAYRSL